MQGKIGRKVDLKSVGKLEQDVLCSFSAASEEIKSAASYALGSICIGNLPYYLPFILNEIQISVVSRIIGLDFQAKIYEKEEEGIYTGRSVSNCSGYN